MPKQTDTRLLDTAKRAVQIIGNWARRVSPCCIALRTVRPAVAKCTSKYAATPIALPRLRPSRPEPTQQRPSTARQPGTGAVPTIAR